MASSNLVSCGSCANNFDASNRGADSLHCGHELCSTCAVKMRRPGGSRCPVCHDEMTQSNVEIFGLIARTNALKPAHAENTTALSEGRDKAGRQEGAGLGAAGGSTSNDNTIMSERLRAFSTKTAENPPPGMISMGGLSWDPKVSEGGPLLDAARAGSGLKTGQIWKVDHNNCLAAVMALSEKLPSRLTIIVRNDEPKSISLADLAAIAGAAKHCEVWLRCLDSFYRPHDTSIDKERLELFQENSRIRVTSFYGHLDTAGIAKLPRTVHTLGLAIGSAADAESVAGLCPWEELDCVHVSVSSAVPVEDLRPLPIVKHRDLFFQYLSDGRVESVRPAIEALMPYRWPSYLRLPDNQLTARGARRLARSLEGAKISGIVIVSRGTWRPDEEEKRSIDAEFRSVLIGCHDVSWDMTSFF